MSTRNHGLDGAKGIAVVLVVLAHVLFGAENLTSRPLVMLSGVVINAIGVFLSVAGHVAAEHPASDYKRTVLARARVLVPLYVIWTVVYVVVAFTVNNGLWPALRAKPLWRIVLLGEAAPHLYYIPAFLQVTVAMPVILWLVREQTRARIALVGAAAFLAVGPYVSHTAVGEQLYARYLLLVFVPHAMAGAAMVFGTLRVRRPLVWLTVGLAYACWEAVVSFDNGVPSTAYFGKAGVMIAMIGLIGWWRERPTAPTSVVATLGRRSLGMYLFHLVPVTLALRVVAPFHVAWSLPLTALLTAITHLVIAKSDGTPLQPVFDGRFGWGPTRRGSAPEPR